MIKTIIRRTGYAFAALLTFGIVVACTNGTSPVNNGHEEPHRFVASQEFENVNACMNLIDDHLKSRTHVDSGTRGYVIDLNPKALTVREGTSHVINLEGFKMPLGGDCSIEIDEDTEEEVVVLDFVTISGIRIH